jgi:D-beta-D-heptose 7-phosphate kinase/D-beta-D-heptose 1-phosphate adenosyltransferase
MNQHEFFQNIISSFQERNVLVIGDAILDVYLMGKSTRLTPEAPVPVVDVVEKKAMPGGASNTVCNLRSLGASVSFCSVVGEDDGGFQLRTLLKGLNTNVEGLISEPGRESQVKTRVMSGGHVITRYDVGTRSKIHSATENNIIQYLKQSFETFDAVIISDYDKGLITSNVLDTIVQLSKTHNKPIAIDSKRLEFFHPLNASLAKPNYEEAISLAGITYSKSDRKELVLSNIDIFLNRINAEIIAVTLDEDGSVIFNRNNENAYCPAKRVDQPHVSGAGDTFLSAALLTMISTKQIRHIQEIATAAASIAISKSNTSSCTNEELLSCFPLKSKTISTLEHLRERCSHYRRLGKRIVFTNGCFDILHSGHVTYLHCAKELGDILIVGINTDESIKRIKGNERPINSLQDRMNVIAGLYSVDHVVPFGTPTDDTPIQLIDIVKPDVFVKGGDYSVEKLPEAKTIEDNGGEIVFIPYIPDHSTTQIINKITKGVKIYEAE